MADVYIRPSDGKYETGSSIERPRPRPPSVADPEWHVSNGNEVKIETEKSDGLKARNFSLVVQACKPGCYSYVRGCVLAGVEQLYTGNLLTVVLAHSAWSESVSLPGCLSQAPVRRFLLYRTCWNWTCWLQSPAFRCVAAAAHGVY